jgi:hypothetical protein
MFMIINNFGLYDLELETYIYVVRFSFDLL